jgi:hypothetical protein
MSDFPYENRWRRGRDSNPLSLEGKIALRGKPWAVRGWNGLIVPQIVPQGVPMVTRFGA